MPYVGAVLMLGEWVDFEYDVDGQKYTYSIEGGSEISIAELLKTLHVISDDPDTEVNEVQLFMDDIEDVGFSDSELVRVDQNDEGEWILTSLEPFDSEETLTVTMKNGDVITVKVTDAAYETTKVTNLDGKTVALVNLANNNALESTTHKGTGHLNAVAISYNASTNTVTTVDPYVVLTKWTFEKVPGTSDQYYIGSSNGYLNINNATRLSVSPTRQALQVQQKQNGTIRIKHPNNNFAVNNDNNTTANGYNAYESTWDANPGEWFTAFETAASSGMIALSPMNENGVLGYWNHTSTSYKNMKIDGVTVDNNHLQNSRMYIPVNFNDNGTATITLPSNSQLSEGFSVSGADPATHTITQDPNKYQWVLHGWVNIATGAYYDVSSGQSVTATVNQDDLNVFYADWWAANYDYSYSDTHTIDTADTSGFATIKMWDYNELFNLTSSTPWSVDHDANQFIPRTTLESEEWYITQVDGHQGDYFQFVDNTDSGNCWQYGTLGNQQGRNNGKEWSNYIPDGSLGILGAQGQVPSTGVLESLFPDTASPGSGVRYLGQSNYLFSYDPATKVYSYNSDQNGAVYNQSEGRFYVGDSPRHHWRGGGSERDTVGFLPLNDPNSSLAYNNGTINYWLGMSIDLDFWLPDTPGSSTNANLVTNTVNGEKHHMRFDFNGDDDVWVLIDGKLALDIGGIHEAVGGYIDFTTGEIRNAKGNTYQLSDMGIGAGAHTLSFYYLERGGNASNCKISFNIVPRWDDNPVKKGLASVTKQWSNDTPEEAKQALSFSLETSDGKLVPDSTVGYADGTETDGVWSYIWTGLDPNQEYKVVEKDDPRFEQTHTTKTTEIKDVWAAASYHKDEAFGSSTILLGNGLTAAHGGRLLGGDGSSVNADIEDDIVKSTVSNSDKWTVEGYSTTNQHFYLKNSSGKFLSIKNGRITLVDSESAASWFYMSPSGDLNDAHSSYRLRVNGDGSIGVATIVNSADETDTNSPDRIHIYRHYDTYAKTTNYEFYNRYAYYGSLDLRKIVRINEFDPNTNDVSSGNKSLANGTYTFTIAGKEGTATEGKNYTVEVVIGNKTEDGNTVYGVVTSATVDGEEAEITETGSVHIPHLVPGEYTITEAEHEGTFCIAVDCSDHEAATDVEGRSATVTVPQDGQGVQTKLVTFTNNFADDSDEDIAHISVRKTFTGLPAGQLPGDFKVTVEVNGETYTLTGSAIQPSGVTFNKTNGDAVVWNWTIAIHGLTTEANVKVQETDYEKEGYTVEYSVNGQSNQNTYTGTVQASTVVASLNSQEHTAGNEKTFPLSDSDEVARIFVARLTGQDKGALVISKKKLNLSERKIVEDKLKSMEHAQDWTEGKPVRYFSFEEANQIFVRGTRVTYNDVNKTVTFVSKQWNMCATFTLGYQLGRPADFNFTNDYTAKEVDLNVVKIAKDDSTIKLPGAKFKASLLDEEQTTAGRVVIKTETVQGEDVPVFSREYGPTDGDGKITLTGLTSGYYMIEESQTPAGYVVSTEEPTFYVYVHGGQITYLVRSTETADTGKKLDEWDKTKTSSGLVSYDMDTKTATVRNESGAALPSSGGPGTVWIYLIGSLLLLGSGIALVARRRMRV